MFEKELTYLKEQIVRYSIERHINKNEEVQETLEQHLCAYLTLWGQTLGGNKKVVG